MSDSVQIVCPHCLAINRVPSQRLADGGHCGKCKQPLISGKPVVLNEGNFAIPSKLDQICPNWTTT